MCIKGDILILKNKCICLKIIALSVGGLVEGAAKHKRFNNNIDMLTRATKAWWEGYSKKNIDIANDTSKKKLELHCYKLKKITSR